MSSASSNRKTLPKALGRIVGGKLDLSNKKLSSLKDIGIQPKLEVLILSNNNIKTFDSLQVQPNLTTIIADNNPIESLKGLENGRQPNLSTLNITQTPLFFHNKNNFAQFVLAVIGPKLMTLNGKRLTQRDQTHANIIARNRPETYENFLKEVNDGSSAWIGDDDQLINLQKDYVRAHEHFFYTFAYNEAVLFDLEAGPLPYIDEYSTDDEIADAIAILRQRNQDLIDKINEYNQ